MKHTLKTLELLEEHIDLLAENGIYEIERDLLLERLRGLYASVVALEAKAEEERVLDALMGLGVVAEAAAEEPELEVERIYAEPEEELATQDVDEPAATEEPEAEVEPEVEEEIAPEDPEESVIELIEDIVEEVEEFANEEEPEIEPEEEVAPIGANRFIGAIEEPTAPEEPEAEVEPEVEEEVATEEESEPAFEPEPEAAPAPEQIDHKAALSLYDDEDDEEPAAESEAEEQIVEEEPEEEPAEEVEESTEEPIEEEQPAAHVEKVTLAELLAAENTVDVATAASSTLSLRQSIGINDKYILMRDLFAGDADYYESAISALDEFDNLDEAMLYIHDNFRWSPNSEGARLLMELLACKLI